MFVCDFGVNNRLLGVIVECFSPVLEFTTVYPLSVYEFPDLCDKLAGPFDSCFCASDVSEIRLLCVCKGCRNET